MALNNDQWKAVTAATDALRALGCVVCIFTPDDVESAVAERTGDATITFTDADALELLSDNRKYIHDAMALAGNEVIDDAVWEKFS